VALVQTSASSDFMLAGRSFRAMAGRRGRHSR